MFSKLGSFGGRLAVGLSAVALVAGLSGCARIKTHQGYLADPLLIDSIRPGIDNRASVEGTLGTPTFKSQFAGGDYYYLGRDMRQLAFNNPETKAQTLVRISFDDAGNVVAVNKSGMEAIKDVDPMGGKTPTLGRNRTLMQDIFGNIGTVNGAGGGNKGGGD